MRSPATQTEAIGPGAARDVPQLSFLFELPVSQPDSPPVSAGGNTSTLSVLLPSTSSSPLAGWSVMARAEHPSDLMFLQSE